MDFPENIACYFLYPGASLVASLTTHPCFTRDTGLLIDVVDTFVLPHITSSTLLRPITPVSLVSAANALVPCKLGYLSNRFLSWPYFWLRLRSFLSSSDFSFPLRRLLHILELCRCWLTQLLPQLSRIDCFCLRKMCPCSIRSLNQHSS